jgi:tetratricopeptide (TPR) repeat protein
MTPWHVSNAALVDLTEAVRLEPNNADSYFNRGLVFAKLGRLLDAVQDQTAAIRLNDRDAAAFVARAVAWERLNRLDDAVEDYRGALAVDPANPTAAKRLLQLRGR